MFLRFVFVFLISTLFACSGTLKKITHPALPSLTDPRSYLKEVIDAADSFKNLSGFVKIKGSTGNGNFSTKNIFFLKRPYYLRLEMLNFINQLSLLFIIDGQNIIVFIPSENSIYTGKATEENIAAITGLQLNARHVVQYLFGFPPVINIEGAELKWDQDKNYYFFEIISGSTMQFLWIDPVLKRITRYKRFVSGVPELTCSFSDFKYRQGFLYPSKTELDFYPYKTKIVIGYDPDSLDMNSVPDGIFRITPSPQTKFFPFEDFLKMH